MKTIISLVMISLMFMFFPALAHAASAAYTTEGMTETEAGAEYFESVPEEQEDPESFQGVSRGSGEDADDFTAEGGDE